MGRLGRDYYKQKLAKMLSMANDEPILAKIAAIDALQAGEVGAKSQFIDCPDEVVGAELGSKYHIPSWTLETLVNELLCSSKQDLMIRQLRYDHLANYRKLTSLIAKLENAEDGIFLAKHDIFNEMHRIGQRQFQWQRGWVNGPALYRALMLYGTGEPARYFEDKYGITVANFLLVGSWLAGRLLRSNIADRFTNLMSVGVDEEMREIALARLSIRHEAARALATKLRAGNQHTAYKRSILRDYPIIAFGEQGQRLRAPLPGLVSHRITSGLYLDTVGGGPKIWKHYGDAFETYCADYLTALLAPMKVEREIEYGPKKRRNRTPDLLVSNDGSVVLVVECKAKRMTFEARFAEDPVAEARKAYEAIADGIRQVWRFLSHARQGLRGLPNVSGDCLGLVITADSWLMMARNQERQVYEIAHRLADEEGDIEQQDRQHVAVSQIDDVESALQNGTAETFLTACREISTGEKHGWILSIAHAAEQIEQRPYPFISRIGEFLPWWDKLHELG